MHVLVTRPEADAARTAQALRERGHDAVLAPLMRMEPVAANFTGPFSAVLLTSANAARALAGHRQKADLINLPAFTVGDRSAQAAREAGFRQVESADGALPDLVRLVTRRVGAGARLLYLAGEDRAGDLAGDLAAHGIAVAMAAIYRTVAEKEFPAQAAKKIASGEIGAALHYSPRSAAILLRLAEQAGVLNGALSLAHYCLSEATAEPLRAAGARRVCTATSPTESALIDLIPG